jgi:Flp pilus assembly protein TadD
MNLLPNHIRPARTIRAVAATAAALLTLSGCATKTVQPAWRIVPVQTVTHGAGSAEGYYTIGRQIEHSRDWARAADAYRQALQVEPGHVDARNALAVALARLGRLADAETQLRQALAAAPQRGDLHSNLGFLLMLAQRPQEAQVALHTALALDPQDRVAQANLQLAQGRASAPATPSTVLAQAKAPAMTAAAPQLAQAGLALRVADQPTLPSLTQQAPRHDTAAVPARPVDALQAKADAASAAASVQAAAADSPYPAFTLELSNGMGRRGAAQQLRQQLQQVGLTVQRTSNQPPYRQPYTMVTYRPGHEAAARRVAQALPLSAPLQPDAAQRSGVRVLMGHDWPGTVQLAGAADVSRE